MKIGVDGRWRSWSGALLRAQWHTAGARLRGQWHTAVWKPAPQHILGIVLFLALTGTTSVAADATSHRGGAPLVIRAGRIYPCQAEGPAVLEPGMILVRDGKIAAIGQLLDIPLDADVVEFPDASVIPGLVAASGSTARRLDADESVAAAYRVIDGFDVYADFDTILAGGVTTVHLSPGYKRLISGQGAVVKLAGSGDQRILKPTADISVNLGESVFGAPPLVDYRTPASSDVEIPLPIRQRPTSRMGQFLEIESRILQMNPPKPGTPAGDSNALGAASAFDYQQREFDALWKSNLPLRVHADRCIDMEAALRFAAGHSRSGYIVGAAEAHRCSGALQTARWPIVYEIDGQFRDIAANLGPDPNRLVADLSTLSQISGVRLALAMGQDQPIEDLRLAAGLAVRGGLDANAALRAVTAVPAEILGVSDRVGRLAPGLDADIVVLTGDPLKTSSHVAAVYVSGQRVFEPPQPHATVVRAGTIWIDDETTVSNGEILIESGKIVSVGRKVPHPRWANIIDAGRDSFVVPGFIDARSHLGLGGDTGSPGSDQPIDATVGIPDIEHRRVARAGITTVLLSAYKPANVGSRLAAVKTAGGDRDELIVRKLAGIDFSVAEQDPIQAVNSLKGRLEAGKSYVEKWTKYEKELEEWTKAKAEGRKVESAKKDETQERQQQQADPISGTWEGTLSGDPMPQSVSFTMMLMLTGDRVEGRLRTPDEPDEAKVSGTFVGKHLSLTVDVDTGGMGVPTIEADLDAEDHIIGKVALGGFSISLEARRTDKAPPQFKMTRKRRGKGGRPLPPKVDDALEPIRELLGGKIPAVVEVRTPAQMEAVLKLLVDEYKVPVVFRNAEDATLLPERLVKGGVGVVVTKQTVGYRDRKPYNQADDLSRAGVMVAFQSDAEDGGRSLPNHVLFAVERGLSASAALRALTIDAAKMFKIDDRVGSIAEGKDADLLIFDGPPFETATRLTRVLISGEEVK